MKMYVVPCLMVYDIATRRNTLSQTSTVDVNFSVGADSAWDGKEERVELVREDKWAGGWW